MFEIEGEHAECLEYDVNILQDETFLDVSSVVSIDKDGNLLIDNSQIISPQKIEFTLVARSTLGKVEAFKTISIEYNPLPVNQPPYFKNSVNP
jgi:hypothetical protein